MAEFAEELTGFSKSIIDIVVFETSELAEMKQEWNTRCTPGDSIIENDDEEE